MANDTLIGNEDVQSLARLANLDLPDNRLDQLQATLATYLDNMSRLRAVDTGDAEPPAITYENEART